MILSKFKRVVIKIILSIILLSFPLYSPVYYKSFYYAGVVLLITLQFLVEIFHWDKKLDERFCVRWRKSRKDGFWINCIRGAAYSFVLMVAAVSLGQFFGNGLTPVDVVLALPGSALPKILILPVVFSSIIGIVYWYENEKKYYQICRDQEKKNC